MVKSISIALILFSASVCLAQNSENHIKDLTSANSTSKVTPDNNVKAPIKEETVGRPPYLDLGTPVLGPNAPANPSNGDDQKKSINNGKNSTKPH